MIIYTIAVVLLLLWCIYSIIMGIFCYRVTLDKRYFTSIILYIAASAMLISWLVRSY